MNADFAVATLFARLQREFDAAAAGKGLTLAVAATEEGAFGDAARVEEILRSLLGNAIRDTERGGVRLQCVREPSGIRIDVADTGAGIAPERLGAIFSAAAPASGAPLDGAAALSLPLLQRLAHLLQLRLEVASELGRGTTFSLHLPHGRAPPGAARGGAAHVLLVEDDAAVRDATRLLLKVEGYRVTAVAGLSEALQAMQTEGAPDLLLTDYYLRDGETGLAVLAALRAQLGDLPAVVMSGDPGALTTQASLDGRLRVAAKPLKRGPLLGAIQGLLAR